MVQVLVTVSLLSSSSANQLCPYPFRNHRNVCMSKPVELKSYCDAWDICESIGGRLAWKNEFSAIQEFSSHAYFYVGVTDLLNERMRSKRGWLNSDGSLVEMENSLWRHGAPFNGHNGDDCLVIFKEKLRDIPCHRQLVYACIYYPVVIPQSSKYFNKDNVTIFNNDSEQGCYDSMIVTSVVKCATLAFGKPFYKSFFYDDIQKNCTLVKHVDSTLPRAWNLPVHNWRRYI